MVRYTVNYLLEGRIVSDSYSANAAPIIPRVGEEVRILTVHMKVTRVVHSPANHSTDVHLSR